MKRYCVYASGFLQKSFEAKEEAEKFLSEKLEEEKKYKYTHEYWYMKEVECDEQC